MPALNIIGELIIYSVLVIIFSCMMVPKFSPSVTKRVNMTAVTILFIIYGIARLTFPQLAPGELSLVLLTMPTFALYWILSRYRGMRFIFLFAVIDVAGFIFGIWAYAAAYYFHLGEQQELLIQIALQGTLLAVFLFNKDRLKEGYRHMDTGWNGVGALVLLNYVMMYFILLYPQPVKRRPEYYSVISVVGLIVLANYWLIFKALGDVSRVYTARQKESEARYELRLEKEKLGNEQMRMLLAQMKPHFTYNTLMAIQELCYTDAEKASELIVNYSEFLRRNMMLMDCPGLVRFRQEVEFVESYVSLQKARFGGSIKWETDIKEEDFEIPPFVLQPLVENAITHGIRNKEGGGTVKLSSWREGKQVFVEVFDDGEGFSGQDPASEGGFSAIENVRTRLQKLCGGRIVIDSRPGRGTRVLIILLDKKEGMDCGAANENCSD